MPFLRDGIFAHVRAPRTYAQLQTQIICFAAALASQRKAFLLTSDSDFSHVEKLIQIVWAN